MLPGETIYSWCGRIHLWNGNISALDTSRQLFGSPYAALTRDFPSHVGALINRVGDQFADAKNLALNHTLLGYFLPFLDPRLAGEIVEKVINGSFPRLKCKLGLAASRVGASHPLKGCVDCFVENEGQYGIAYWHIRHQYPSVFICARHRRLLTITGDAVAPFNRRQWLLPVSNAQKSWLDPPIVDTKQIEVLEKLSAFSGGMASRPIGSLQKSVLARVYRYGLNRSGFLSSASELKNEKFGRAMRSYYYGLTELPGMHIIKTIDETSAGFVDVLSKTIPRNGHPLKHALLMTMLFENWNVFLQTYEKANAEPSQWPLRGIAFSTHVLKDEEKNLVAAPQPNDETLVAPALVRQVCELIAAGNTKVAIAATIGITRAALNRMIYQEPAVASVWRSSQMDAIRKLKRERFLILVRENSGATLQEIRKLQGNGYLWLSRNDRLWLEENLPAIWRPGPA